MGDVSSRAPAHLPRSRSGTANETELEDEVVKGSEPVRPHREADQERRGPPLPPGARALVDAWLGRGGDGAAALALAAGDPLAAAAMGGKGMRALAESRLEDALAWARSRPGSAAKTLVGAEALIAGGRIVAGLEGLERLTRRRDPAGTLAFARRCHLLGDHARAEAAASRLPFYPGAALIGARSALAAGRGGAALGYLHPFLGGEASTTDPVQTGAIGAAAAAALARLGKTAELAAFARRLLGQRLVPPEMLPAIARIAWTAGLAADAWERLEREPGPWREAARLELAILAGDPDRAAAEAAAAGPLSEPCRGLLEILSGRKPRAGEGAVLAKARSIEVWRTHPARWDPWIEALKRVEAEVFVPDLARGSLPPDTSAPDLVIDDGGLVDLVEPVPVAARPLEGGGIWVDPVLCAGVGIGHDWPEAEHRALLRGVRAALAPETARVRVVSAETALEGGAAGKPRIVLAPPGDPFWAGPLPERAWPAMRVARADPARGWAGMGVRIGALARDMAGS